MSGSIPKTLIRCVLSLSILFFMNVHDSLAEIKYDKKESHPLPGGTLNPHDIPKYVSPLVIPPVMKNDNTGSNNYDIAVRQFKQQVLPAGFPATTVWSYGPASDPTPAVAPDPGSQFNYPAYTMETTSNTPVNVRWINDLIDANGNFLPHFLPIDQTLHWGNPPATGCKDGSARTDCATENPLPYDGPIPIVPHVHGAHVDGHSDGYPEAWWLPAAANLPPNYATSGSLFDDATGTNPGNLGYADYTYRNDQPATTLWYHDHSLGITRLNVYAGPAGFWLVRGGAYDSPTDSGGNSAVLPGPAPVTGQGVSELNTPGDPTRNSIREIPIVIQDRSFNEDGSLFYPPDRGFFDDFNGPYIGDPVTPTDISPTWNPEGFFQTMVVNGTTWPKLEVAPALYRFRVLNGSNSRALNLALFENLGETITSRIDPATGEERLSFDFKFGQELPWYQIGAEQGFLPKVVKITTGFATALPGDGSIPAPVKASREQQTVLLAPAERADVIIDFRGLPNGTVIRMFNTAPDTPFRSFPALPADIGTSGQVMEFVVNNNLLVPADANTTPPEDLNLTAEPDSEGSPVAQHRQVSVNETASGQVCVVITTFHEDVVVPAVAALYDIKGIFDPPKPRDEMILTCEQLDRSVPMFPTAALLGAGGITGPHPITNLPLGTPLRWTDNTGASELAPVKMQHGATEYVFVTEDPKVGDIEEWEIYNFTVDAHPIHLHLVRFEVIERRMIPGTNAKNNNPTGVHLAESGFEDTVIAYPGEIVKVRAHFDLEGLYVWHCHILEHEDNEMMRPFVVTPVSTPPPPPDTTAPIIIPPTDVTAVSTTGNPIAVAIGTATATDDTDPNPAITNDAPATFPVGTTTVTWTATDASGNSASATQNIVVTLSDTTAPNITAPPDITSVGQPASIGTATATDDTDPNPTITNDAPATFPVGITTVTWTATDASGNSASATQTVTVTDPPPPGSDIHVADLDGSTLALQEGKWTATVTVLITDNSGAGMDSAVVNATWTWLNEGEPKQVTGTCTSSGGGLCSITSNTFEKSTSATLTVDNVSHPTLAYDSAANTDPDGDSDGNSITVNQP